MEHSSAEKKILIITYYWPPSGGSGVQRWLKFTKYLKRLGWSPIVLTVDPERASYFLRDESLLDAVEPGIEIHRTKTFELLNIGSKILGKKNIAHSGFSNVDKENNKQRILRFIRGNMFAVDPRKGWNKFAYRKALELIEEKSILHVITTSPPHSTQLIGKKLKKRLGDKINWLADMRDPWTDIFYYKHFLKMPFLVKKEKELEKAVLNSADQIITVSNGLKRIFADKIQEPDKIEIIENGYDLSDFEKESQKANDLSGTFNVLYIGVINETYNLRTFFQVIRKLVRDDPGIHLSFVGVQSDHFRADIIEAGIADNVTYYPYARKSELMGYYQQSDLQLLAIPDIEGNEGIVTGKIFEYLSLQKPIIGIGPKEGDAAKILSETDAGEMFDYSDEKGLATYIQAIKSATKQHTFKGIEKYSRQALTERLITLLEGH